MEPQVSRRTVLKAAGAGLVASFGIVEPLAWLPRRLAMAAPPRLPDIQHDIGAYIAPVQSIDGVSFHFGPVHTLLTTLALTRTPGHGERQAFADALDRIEAAYPFSPAGVFTSVAYGGAYFARLPGALVAERMPRLLSDRSRPVLEDAVPGPTDVTSGGSITKATFNVPVRIEHDDVLITLRSDSASIVRDVMEWLLGGSDSLNGRHVPSPRFDGLLTITSSRLMFNQLGLPRRIADSATLPYASRINPRSPMWMGFSDGQTDSSAAAPATTFAGNHSARLSTAQSGDYFDNGSIQVLNHVILDLAQFYADSEPFTERVQYMFRSTPIPSEGYADQYGDGGGGAFFANPFQGVGDAENNAAGTGTYNGEKRMGHVCALQRSSRASDGTPLHIRVDGPGYDTMDVPDGSAQPKLQFSAYVPSSDVFARMRVNQASLDLVTSYGVAAEDNGLERFITATRRQNFLSPPRRHRAFPLLEQVRAAGR